MFLWAQTVVHIQYNTIQIANQYFAHLLHNIRTTAEETTPVVIYQHWKPASGVVPLINPNRQCIPIGTFDRDVLGIHALSYHVVALVLPKHLPWHGNLLGYRCVLLGLWNEVQHQRHHAHGLEQPGVNLTIRSALRDGLDQNGDSFVFRFKLSLPNFVQQGFVKLTRHRKTS